MNNNPVAKYNNRVNVPKTHENKTHSEPERIADEEVRQYLDEWDNDKRINYEEEQ